MLRARNKMRLLMWPELSVLREELRCAPGNTQLTHSSHHSSCEDGGCISTLTCQMETRGRTSTAEEGIGETAQKAAARGLNSEGRAARDK